MYSVYQHWDPLKVCIVGRSYNPKFYDYISNEKVRRVFYRIAEETEEDYQSLIQLLHKFNVEILRPDVSDNYEDYLDHDGKILPPPMTPRDVSAMIGDTFYIDTRDIRRNYFDYAGDDWPKNSDVFENITPSILDELQYKFGVKWLKKDWAYDNIIEQVRENGKVLLNQNIDSAMCARIGKDLFVGTNYDNEPVGPIKKRYQKLFPEHRIHVINSGGHADSTYCPVHPGLIISHHEMPSYKKTFPNWEVIHIENKKDMKSFQFQALNLKNKGKWWVPGEEFNDDFTNYVESYMQNWIGAVHETIFDVNMLIIDKTNVVCNSYNEKVFDALGRYGITPHVVNFRHRYFWDGGLHCITSDLHREGFLEDFFPQRN